MAGSLTWKTIVIAGMSRDSPAVNAERRFLAPKIRFGPTRSSAREKFHCAQWRTNVIPEIDYYLSVMDQLVSAAYTTEISLAQTAFQNGDYSKCFYHLERAHILGQRSTVKHTYAHWLMFRVGVQQGDFREILGQVPRMLASLLFSRIWVPVGNTGRSRVPAMKVMPIPDDLRHLLQ